MRWLILLLLLIPSIAFAADTTIDGTVNASVEEQNSLWGPFYNGTSNAVIVYVDDSNNVVYQCTSDSGSTWDTPTTLHSGTVKKVAAWYDFQTPGYSDDKVHVAWIDDNTTDAVEYNQIDVSACSSGTEYDVDTTITADTASNNNRLAITKAKSGRLYLCGSTQTEIFCYESDSATGATWSAIADAMETARQEDHIRLFPADTADNNDMVALFHDRSVNDVSIKMYDESANNYTETDIHVNVVDNITRESWCGTTRHSDGALLLGLFNNMGGATSPDFETYEIQVDSIASPTVTQKTNVFTNDAESGFCEIIINNQNDDVYIGYAKGGTFLSSTSVVFHKSTDNMATWGTEQSYQETADNTHELSGPAVINSEGGMIQFSWNDDTDNDIMTNLVNDVEIAASGGGGTISFFMSVD